jgi:uncharacterized cysteine cluster protein YcgN (CxxCxxCC family)
MSRANCSTGKPRAAPTISMDDFPWLPRTCSYRLLARGEPLPDWHYLVCGDREAVHKAGESVRGWTISELDAGDLEYHCVDRDL